MDRKPAVKDKDKAVLLVKGIATHTCLSVKKMLYVLLCNNTVSIILLLRFAVYHDPTC